MACIFLMAVVLGITWNQRLLYTVWQGGAISAAPAQVPGTAPADTPLPLGLLQVKELYDRREAVFVDARDGAAFAAGHMKGALSLPVGEAQGEGARFRERVPLSMPVVVYCNGYDCHDSMELGMILRSWGYGTVYVFEGGYPEWRDAGYQTAGGVE
ncbi:MAG: rhodanese-like domain-containing protein [Geobacteraceae bacterium]|nr:rhodanese-like domain-containing protein [Geobacteraceae bacterium]